MRLGCAYCAILGVAMDVAIETDKLSKSLLLTIIKNNPKRFIYRKAYLVLCLYSCYEKDINHIFPGSPPRSEFALCSALSV